MSKLKKLDDFIDNKIVEETLEDILGERFGKYSKYIIQDRALPDVRDGLKPVQRRILYAMNKMGMNSNSPYKKSARIAGEVMGKYHPHGDSSIYDAMVRLSQPWKQGVCLVDMHGNNGSIDGDSAAAMRYTEARLTKEAESLLEDIDKRTVLFIPNFDDEELEPTVLPAKFPNLLVNGGAGISSGYATKIPPHNLKEVVLATIKKIDKPDMSLDELLEIMPGPDFPTGGIVQGKEGIKEAFLTGRGRVIVRSKTDIETISKDTYRIVITEIPYEVNKGDLVKSIDMIRISKKLEDINEVRDESDREGLRIAVDLKRDANVDTCLNYLLKNTEMQINFHYNMVAINQQRPVQMGVFEILDSYINHQKEVITNRSNYILNRAEKRLHIVLGLIKMVSILDEVINTIRQSKNKQDSKNNIMKKFDFSELQAEAIVTLQLYRLSSTDINALIKEQGELENQIEELKEILSSERKLLNLIKKELRTVARTLGSDRKSLIEEEIDQLKIDKMDLIVAEDVRVAVTKDGYIKRSSIRSYKASQTIGMKENDGLMFDADVSTHDTLLMFTTRGNYIYQPVYDLDESRWGDLGTYVNNIIPIAKDEYIIKVLVVSDFDEDTNILMATKKGRIKQSLLKDYEVSRYSRLIRGMNVSKKDELVSVDLGTKYNIIVFTKRGDALRMMQEEVPTYGAQTSGVKALDLKPRDEVATALYAKNDDELLVISQSGHIRREKVENIPLSKRLRATSEFWSYRTRNPHFIVDAARLSKEQKKADVRLLMTSKKGYLDINISDLRPSVAEYGRGYLPAGRNGKTLFINLEKVEEEKDYDLEEALKQLELRRIQELKEQKEKLIKDSKENIIKVKELILILKDTILEDEVEEIDELIDELNEVIKDGEYEDIKSIYDSLHKIKVELHLKAYEEETDEDDTESDEQEDAIDFDDDDSHDSDEEIIEFDDEDDDEGDVEDESVTEVDEKKNEDEEDKSLETTTTLDNEPTKKEITVKEDDVPFEEKPKEKVVIKKKEPKQKIRKLSLFDDWED